jgi:hypothetical protein
VTNSHAPPYAAGADAARALGLTHPRDLWHLLLTRVIMHSMAYCELCEMDRESCEHGLMERRRAATAVAGELLISPNGVAHFPGCPHKGDDPDYRLWATLDTPRAWQRLGNGEQVQATGGERPDLVAVSRCQDCLSHGPW